MNIEEVKKEIQMLEQADTNWQNIQRLAWLYTVLDHAGGMPLEQSVMKMPMFSGEFGEVVSGANVESLMNILSEHMSVIKVLHPKEYQAVVERIARIPR